ncbi:DNA-binding barrel domain superfamily [Sesbania bispinosa]|nr:DNA-binding barrel domain superfamily [Sesbania bispinosa]
MDSTPTPSLGASTANAHRRDTPVIKQRNHRNINGFQFRTIWHPYQKHIVAAKRLTDNLQQPLPPIVKFKDPTGNEREISVTVKAGRQCFSHGLGQLWQFYELDDSVHLNYTYMGNSEFNITISRIDGLGEILYPHSPLHDQHIPQPPQHVPVQPPQQHDIANTNDPEEVLGVPGEILWTFTLTKAHEKGGQGLVVPVRIVDYFLEDNQKKLPVKLPNGAVQHWVLLWNTKIHKHCRLGQGWYQYCREEKLHEGDQLSFWQLHGDDFIRVVLRKGERRTNCNNNN